MASLHLVLRLRGGDRPPEHHTVQGATTLQGRSKQTFAKKSIGELDHAHAVTLIARLVGVPEELPTLRAEKSTSLRSACPKARPV